MSKRQLVLITGATRGLGAAVARYLARHEWNIALTDLSDRACNVYEEVPSVDSLIDELRAGGALAGFFPADLTSAEQAERMVACAVAGLGPISALVALAGGDICGLDDRAAGGKAPNNTAFALPADFMSVFNRNLLTCIHACRAVGARMREAGHGKILTVASVSAGFGVTRETAYAVAKAGVVHFTRSLAAELRPSGVNVNCIAPGATNTGRFRATLRDRTPEDIARFTGQGRLQRIADPGDVCPVIEFFLSPASDFVSGQVLRVDGGQFTSPM